MSTSFALRGTYGVISALVNNQNQDAKGAERLQEKNQCLVFTGKNGSDEI